MEEKGKMEKNKNKVKSDIIFITLKIFHLFYMINVNIKLLKILRKCCPRQLGS